MGIEKETFASRYFNFFVIATFLQNRLCSSSHRFVNIVNCIKRRVLNAFFISLKMRSRIVAVAIFILVAGIAFCKATPVVRFLFLIRSLQGVKIVKHFWWKFTFLRFHSYLRQQEME